MADNTTIHPSAISGAFSDIEDIIADIQAGKMVIMVDDENRENEGDLLMAAQHVRPEDINYMATYGRGLICLTLSRERCAQLRLPLMVSDTDHHHATNFTLSIEAAEGITTGISAHDRARTIQAAVEPAARPEHLSQPGHIFPVMAQPGGPGRLDDLLEVPLAGHRGRSATDQDAAKQQCDHQFVAVQR